MALLDDGDEFTIIAVGRALGQQLSISWKTYDPSKWSSGHDVEVVLQRKDLVFVDEVVDDTKPEVG